MNITVTDTFEDMATEAFMALVAHERGEKLLAPTESLKMPAVLCDPRFNKEMLSRIRERSEVCLTQ